MARAADHRALLDRLDPLRAGRPEYVEAAMKSALDGVRAVVIGAARSGRGAARVLAARGARVRVLERDASAQRGADWPAGVELRAGGDEHESLDNVDLV